MLYTWIKMPQWNQIYFKVVCDNIMHILDAELSWNYFYLHNIVSHCKLCLQCGSDYPLCRGITQSYSLLLFFFYASVPRLFIIFICMIMVILLNIYLNILKKIKDHFVSKLNFSRIFSIFKISYMFINTNIVPL